MILGLFLAFFLDWETGMQFTKDLIGCSIFTLDGGGQPLSRPSCSTVKLHKQWKKKSIFRRYNIVFRVCRTGSSLTSWGTWISICRDCPPRSWISSFPSANISSKRSIAFISQVRTSRQKRRCSVTKGICCSCNLSFLILFIFLVLERIRVHIRSRAHRAITSCSCSRSALPRKAHLSVTYISWELSYFHSFRRVSPLVAPRHPNRRPLPRNKHSTCPHLRKCISIQPGGDRVS